MTVHSKLTLAAAAAAMVLVTAAPASARGYGGRWGRYPQHHRGNDNTGAVIGAILGVGLIAAIASSAARQREADRRYPPPRTADRNYDPRYDDRGYDGRDYRAGDYEGGYGNRDSGYTGAGSADGYGDDGYENRADYAGSDEDAAVDACALAAHDEASRSGSFAEIRDITGARPFGNGWDVTGTVSQRASYRAGDDRIRSFRCIWDDGRVEGVTFG